MYQHRFEIFFASQLALLFGSLFYPPALAPYITPILFYFNIVAGSLFFGLRSTSHYLNVLAILLMGLILMGPIWIEEARQVNYLKFSILFIIYLLITYQIIRQVWLVDLIDNKVIFGMMSGFISLGYIGFFIFMTLEIFEPGSFKGIEADVEIGDNIMYLSFITLLTIGYGDIYPATILAKKASILVGLIGQFYLVIITAIVVGKFINQNSPPQGPEKRA